MYWIYIPPIIFIAGLVVLVVILGKKSAAIKRRKDFLPEKKEKVRLAGGRSLRMLKNFWAFVLRFVEALIYYARIGIKKSETGLGGAMQKIREYRSGKREISLSIGEQRLKDIELPDDNIAVISKEAERGTIRNADIVREIDYVHEEIVVKKKPEIAPKRVAPENLAEDKVREDALIHRIAENPRDMEAYRELGDYYLAVGNIKDAKDSFKMVLKLRPRDLKAKSSLREIELRMRLGS